MNQRAPFLLCVNRHGCYAQSVGLRRCYVLSSLILFRFSQDISLIDRQLPVALTSFCTRKLEITVSEHHRLMSLEIFKMIVQVAILLQTQKQLLLSLPVCIVLVYMVQRIYLRTSRQLRALELESQSGLYSWFLETVRLVLPWLHQS